MTKKERVAKKLLSMALAFIMAFEMVPAFSIRAEELSGVTDSYQDNLGTEAEDESKGTDQELEEPDVGADELDEEGDETDDYEPVNVTGIKAAAYLGATDVADTTLPVEVDFDGETKEVAWAIDGKFSTAYDEVTVTGTSEDGDTATAVVDVIPEGIVFFGDVGAIEEYNCGIFGRINELLGKSSKVLINDAADQVDNGTWGHNAYNASGTQTISYKGKASGVAEKVATGIYTANAAGAKITYRMTLGKGVYDVTLGIYNWWASYSRSYDIYITTPSGVRTKVNDSTLSDTQQLTYEVNVYEDGDVLIEIVGTNNQSPVLSWIAAEKTGDDPGYEKVNVTGLKAAALLDATDVTDTTLPETVTFNGTEKAVTWDIDADTFSTKYDEVEVTGKSVDGDTATALVDVVPEGLVFFADIGSTKLDASVYPSSYEQMQDLLDDALLNNAADQLDDGEWGLAAYNASSNTVDPSYKGHYNSSISKTLATGVTTSNAIGAKLTYRLQLEKTGYYDITLGMFDWWPTSRTSDVYITLPGGERTKVNTTAITYPTNESSAATSGPVFPVEVTETGEVLIEVVAISYAQSPILSWVAVEKTETQTIVDDDIEIVLNADDIMENNENGLTFKGFGVLSANSTSDLMMDYKAQNPEAYQELMQVLFGGDNPIMTHVKIEMGNDRNNSTGAEAATIRTADEEANVLRNPGWQLAADAKTINPDVKVSILRWNAPSWVSDDDDAYTWYKETILAAYYEYGYMVDYINPNVNEHWESGYVQATIDYAARIQDDTDFGGDEVAEMLFKQIQLVVSDEVGTGTFGNSLYSNDAFMDAVDVAGFHYNTNDDSNGNFTKLADETDKEVWNSEAQATFSNSTFRPNNNTADPSVEGTGIGGTGSALEMGNTVIKGFVNSRRSHVIYQPAIISFYDGGQYSSKGLLDAKTPWSGYIHYDAGLVILQHFTNFATVGWENETNTAGIWRLVPGASATTATGTNPVNGRNGGENYMTMASPDKTDFSTVIVNDSEYTLSYKIKVEDMTLNSDTLQVWETREADADEAYNANYMQNIGTLERGDDGYYRLSVKPYSIVTVTTLTNDTNIEIPSDVDGDDYVLDTDYTGDKQDTTDEYLYADDFDYSGKTVPNMVSGGEYSGSTDYIAARGGDTGAIARYTNTINGAFEVYKTDNAASGNYVLRQQLDYDTTGVGGAWNGGDAVVLIGDMRWTNYKAATDILFENVSATPYAAIAIRQYGDSATLSSAAYYLQVWSNGDWSLLRRGSTVASGNAVDTSGFKTGADVWNNIALQGAGSTITAYINGVEVATYEDSTPILLGRIALGSSYYNIQFDNLEVTKVDGYIPYYNEALDNFEMYYADNVSSTRLIYGGSWSHTNGNGMYDYSRTLSKNTATGATLTYTFTGTGLDIMGTNDGSAILKVTVDGDVIESAASTQSSSYVRNTYSLRGLSSALHTVTLEVISGTLTVDMVATVGANASGSVDTSELEATIAALEDAEQGEASDNLWAVFKSNYNAGEGAISNPESYGLDQEGADALVDRIKYAYETLSGIAVSTDSYYVATYVGQQPQLPSTVTVTYAGDSTKELDVVWNYTSTMFDTAWDTVSVTGTLYDNGISLTALSATATVEVVPKNLVYFIDSGSGGSTTRVSTAYTAIDELTGNALLNRVSDQAYSDSVTWGYDSTQIDGISGDSTWSGKSTDILYGKNNSSFDSGYVEYTLPLDAGTYNVSLGFYERWTGPRTQTVIATYTNSEGEEVVQTICTNVQVSSSNRYQMATNTITIENAADVKIKSYMSAGTEASVIAWLGISNATTAGEEYSVTVQSGTGGNASASVAAAEAGETVTIRAIPASGYTFKEWQVVSGGVTITNNSFIMPEEDVVIKAVFELIPVGSYSVTVSGSYASVTGAGSYAEGDTVTIYAGSRSGYTFGGWSSSDGVVFENASAATTTFVMLGKNVTVTANWNYLGGDGNAGSGGGSESSTDSDTNSSSGSSSSDTSTSSSENTSSSGTSQEETVAIGEEQTPLGTIVVSSGGVSLSFDGSGYISGFEDGTVRPDDKLTRGQLAVMLYQLVEDKDASGNKDVTFSDLNGDEYYYEAIMFFAENGILNGYPDGTFKADNSITRSEAAAVLANFIGDKAVIRDIEFSDISGHWAEQSILALANCGIISGYEDETFRPDNEITRAEIITLINKTLELDSDVISADKENRFTDLDQSHWAYKEILTAVKSE